MMTNHEAWLNLTKEEPIDPDVPICDPHHHFWDRADGRYLLDELLCDVAGNNVTDTVFVECRSEYRKGGPEEMRSLGETEFVERIAEGDAARQSETRVAAGIVGFADLTLGAAVERVLEAQLATSPTRLRGVRQISTWDDSPDIWSRKTPNLLSSPKLREGFALLHKYGLSFDAWLYHTQIMELVDLARAFPETPIIMDHVGTPLGRGPYAKKRKEVFQEWKRGIAALATCPNAILKLGGFGMEYFGFGWNDWPAPPGSAEVAATIAPYFNWCIERFGPERCMFESNFPVDRVSYSYTVLCNAFKRLSKDFSPHERAALFHDTAARVYRLPQN